MRKTERKISWIWPAFVLVSLFSTNYPQEKSAKIVQPVKAEAALGSEEQLIRLAYRKLAVYNAAEQNRTGKKLSDIVGGREGLSFKVSNFKSGNIDALKNTRYNDLVAEPTGEIVQLIRSGVKANNAEEQVGYSAVWVPGKYATMFDRNWTIGDVLKIETSRYWDVTRYTTYDVSVSFQGKSRSYQALVLYHGELNSLKLEFLDTIVGFGGTVTSVWEEQSLPIGFKKPARKSDHETFSLKVNKFLAYANKTKGVGVTCPAGATDIEQCDIDPELAEFWGVTAQRPWKANLLTGAKENTTENLIPDQTETWVANDYRAHISGGTGHYGWGQFAGRCIGLPSNQQRCEVLVNGPEYGDNNDNHTDWYYHVGTGRQQTNPRTGPRGQNVDCEAAVGVAFDTCLTSGCGVSMTLGISGQGASASYSITGGSLWNGGRAEGLRCNMASAGGCQGAADYDLFPGTGCASGFVNAGGTCTRSNAFMN
jgi:hypothetical protein